MGLLRTFSRSRSGAAAAEMALMLPLLILILFGGMEAGYFLWNEHKVVKGVRDGARFAGRQSFTVVNCAGNDFSDANVIAAVKNVTRTGTADGSGAPVVPGWDDNATEVSISISCDSTTKTGIFSSLADGAPRVTVSATVPYTPLFGDIAFDLSSIDLNAEAQAAVMGI